MHTCPPCRQFTPIFAELYNEINENGKVLEVIFASADRTDQKFNEYYKEMPWLALPRGDPVMNKLAQIFKVRTVPRLIIMKTDGTVIDDDAVQKIVQEGPGAIEEYLSV